MTPPLQTERMKNLLAFLLVGSFVSCIPLFVFKNIPEANKDILNYMLGQLSGMALLALGAYFVNRVGQDALDAQRLDVDAKRVENTAKTMEAISAVAGTSPPATDGVGQAAAEVADAAADRAAQIKGEGL